MSISSNKLFDLTLHSLLNNYKSIIISFINWICDISVIRLPFSIGKSQFISAIQSNFIKFIFNYLIIDNLFAVLKLS